MVIVVAAVLSFAAIQLQPRQEANVKIEKMEAILTTIGKGATEGMTVESAYETYIKQAFFVDSLGNTTDVTPEDALGALSNLSAVFASRTAMPVFVATIDKDGTKVTEYIVPLMGKGMWGPVWGYVALSDDGNTIVGAVFDHKGETPGLGAEITTDRFEKQFIGKQIFNSHGQYVSVDLLKGKNTLDNPNAVDAISGGTITSTGVRHMLKECLGDYAPFFTNIKNKKGGVN